MSDRELLELAAKAAQVSVVSRHDDKLWVDYRGVGVRAWSPLTDDGDAFRLAVKLGIRFEQVVGKDSPFKEGHALASYMLPDAIREEHYVTNREDAFAASREVIVRAAAEIGRGMG